MQQTPSNGKSIKWPQKLKWLKVGQCIDVKDCEEVAARKAKYRLEKGSLLRFTIRRNQLTGILQAQRLKDIEEETVEHQAA